MFVVGKVTYGLICVLGRFFIQNERSRCGNNSKDKNFQETMIQVWTLSDLKMIHVLGVLVSEKGR